ncbi:MAG: mannose-1-phosphate guanylyltransferase, partial [Cyanobacteria bacterium HKST-UBA03]|nr:mannose-1-phosphate guanylyltransferase [Cyanobacteria bacterium HKST-UBA03]
FQDTVLRAQALEGAHPPMVVTNAAHAGIIADQLFEIHCSDATVLLEPVGRNTAPAIIVAALTLLETDPEAWMLVMPSDHMIENEDVFRQCVADAIELGPISTFGIVPHAPHTGFGYIRRGDVFGKGYIVDAFIEKPPLEVAIRFVDSGEYYWNSGLFVFHAATLLEYAQRLMPELVSHCQATKAAAKSTEQGLMLDKDAFSHCQAVSIDYALMEHMPPQTVAVMPCEMGWNDVGSWSSIWALKPKDEQGNVTEGDVVKNDVANCYIKTHNRPITAIGVENLIIIESPQGLLIASQDKAQEIKRIVDTST